MYNIPSYPVTPQNPVYIQATAADGQKIPPMTPVFWDGKSKDESIKHDTVLKVTTKVTPRFIGVTTECVSSDKSCRGRFTVQIRGMCTMLGFIPLDKFGEFEVTNPLTLKIPCNFETNGIDEDSNYPVNKFSGYPESNAAYFQKGLGQFLYLITNESNARSSHHQVYLP